MKQKRVEREEKEKQEQLQREKQRRMHGKEMTHVKQKYVRRQFVAACDIVFVTYASEAIALVMLMQQWKYYAVSEKKWTKKIAIIQ